MSPHESTSSRRFLPLSSSFVTRRTEKSPALHKVSSQFLRPDPPLSSRRLSQATSPIVPLTPSTAAKTRDEIESSFEDINTSSPPLPSRLRFQPSIGAEQDRIDARTKAEKGGKGRWGDPLLDDSEDDMSELLYLESLRGTSAIPIQTDDDDDPFDEIIVPINRKKRKLFETQDYDQTAIMISSSSAAPDTDIRSGSPLMKSPLSLRSREHDFHPEEDVLRSPKSTPASPVSSRFKAATPALFSAPRPTPGNKHLFTKHTERFAEQQASTECVALPDAFSPSRRRGRQDYLPGGAADTVRGWILGLGSEDSRSGQAYHEKIRITEVADSDPESRCILATDDKARPWMLINSGSQHLRANLRGAKTRVQVGSLVGVKARKIQCVIDVGLSQVEASDSRLSIGTDGAWNVGVLWDILE